jgi:hypothetical protein
MPFFKISENKNSQNQEEALAEIKGILEKRGLSGVVVLYENNNLAKDFHLNDNLSPMESLHFCAAMLVAGEVISNAFSKTFKAVSQCSNPMCQSCRQKMKNVRDN